MTVEQNMFNRTCIKKGLLPKYAILFFIYKCKSQIIQKLENQKPKYMFIFIEVILQNYYGMQVQILSEATSF